jgi:hypothetical protein
MTTTEQGSTNQHDGQMDKLRISNGQIQEAPLASPMRDDAGSMSDRVSDTNDGLLAAGLRRNFIIPPKERALECIAVLLTLARTNLGTSQRNLHASKRAENEKELKHWKWESIHWLRRCGKWSNHKRKVESR